MILQKLLILLIFLFANSLVQAAPQSPQLQKQNQKLKQLNQQITSAQTTLQTTQQSAAQLSDQLKAAEKNIGDLSIKIAALTKQVNTQKQQLAPLQKQQQQLAKQLATQRASLAAILRSAYQTHQETYLKLLLNQTDPEQFSRMMHYYHYYSSAKITLINQVNTTLTQLVETQNQIQTNIATLNSLQQQKIAEQQQLKQAQQARKSTLLQVKSKIQTQQQKLNQLKENKATLQTLIDHLSQTEFLNTIEFAKLKGRLPWPVAGRISQAFGSKQLPQSLPSQGVFISAKADSPVNVIAPGKVVFADWLKGFGLLIIVDHGKGYMTLYAHCNSLLKKVGDTVTAVTPIATAGDSGGIDSQGILFQIRKAGKPLNPSAWCKGRP